MAGLVIAPDYQEVLAGGGVPTRRVVVDAAVAGVDALNKAVAQWAAALDDPPAHDRKYKDCVVW